MFEIPQSVRQKLQQGLIGNSANSRRPKSAPVPPPRLGSMGAVEVGKCRQTSDLPKAEVTAPPAAQLFPTEQRNR